jgi:hypothetical protein
VSLRSFQPSMNVPIAAIKSLTAQHRDLVPQREDLGVLGGVGASE